MKENPRKEVNRRQRSNVRQSSKKTDIKQISDEKRNSLLKSDRSNSVILSLIHI